MMTVCSINTSVLCSICSTFIQVSIIIIFILSIFIRFKIITLIFFILNRTFIYLFHTFIINHNKRAGSNPLSPPKVTPKDNTPHPI
jgi:hypothetical protein